MVLSNEPEAIRLPSGEIATDHTGSVCPRSGSPTCTLVSKSQTLIVRSSEPETMYLPSDEIAADHTESVCPRSGSPT